MKSYRRINAVKISVDILKCLADQREPVSGHDVARSVDIKYDTVMCHLTTLEDTGLVRTIGDRYELSMGMAMFWTKMKSRKEADKQRIEHEIKLLQTGD
ncbi:MAG: helix-turn-helix domain-containing protein [Thermodesulfobacteriota bacterium]|nr:helix-turn-helix domain-containing protein [Thermodesulfobacteriota bacterium]